MNCLKCKAETVKNEWGEWCDTCGGVLVPSAPKVEDGVMREQPPRLFFRLVAIVEGAGGRFPIIYDLSESAYGVAWPSRDTVKCIHCKKETPLDPKPGLEDLGARRGPFFHSRRGSLDAMVALIQPYARGGEDKDFPTIHRTPTTTPEEASLLGFE